MGAHTRRAGIEIKVKEGEEETSTRSISNDGYIYKGSDFHSDYSNLLMQNFSIISDFLEKIKMELIASRLENRICRAD